MAMFRESSSHAFGRITTQDHISHEFNKWLYTFLNSQCVYIGPAHQLQERLSYYVSASTDGAFLLVKGADDILRMISNVCTHYKKQIKVPARDWSDGYLGKLEGGFLTCNGHQWVFDALGTHIAPHYLKVVDGTQCTDLNVTKPLEIIGGLAWMGFQEEAQSAYELLGLTLARDSGIAAFLPENYRLSRVWVDHAPYTPLEGMIVYEDCNHLGKGIHPGKVDRVVRMSHHRVGLTTSGRGSLQVVPWIEDPDYSQMSKYWRLHHESVKKWRADGYTDQTVGQVAWIAHYPDFLTIEQYPFMIVNSRFAPTYGGGTRNVVEFYFPEEILAFEPEFADIGIAAYRGDGVIEGIAQEDSQLAQDIGKGFMHCVAFGRGSQVIGPLEPQTEKGVHSLQNYLAEHWKMHTDRSR